MPENFSPSYRVNPVDGGERDIEQLAKIQAEHQARVGDQRDAKAAEIRAKQQAIETAGPDYKTRAEVVAQAKAADAAISTMPNIKWKITNAENQQDIRRQLEAKLAAAQEKLVSISDIVTQLDGIVRDVDGDQELIAPEVLNALLNAKEKFSAICLEVEQLERALKQQADLVVTDQELNEYIGLTTQIKGLNDQIASLCQNPELMKLLHSEAQAEDGVRREIINRVLEFINGRQEGPRRVAYLTQLVNTLLTEIMKAKKVSQHDNSDWNTRELNEWKQEVMEGMKIYGNNRVWEGRGGNNPNLLLGKLVNNLTGQFGTLAITHKIINECGLSIEQLLHTLNFIKSYMVGLSSPEARYKILGIRELQDGSLAWSDAFAENLKNFQNGSDQPLLPNDFPEGTKEPLIKEYRANLQAAKVLEEDVLREEQDYCKARLGDVKGEIAIIEAKFEEDNKAQLELKGLPDKVPSEQEIEQKKSKMTAQVNRVESLNQDLAAQSLFSIGRRRGIQQQIKESELIKESLEREIRAMEAISTKHLQARAKLLPDAVKSQLSLQYSELTAEQAQLERKLKVNIG